MYRHQQTLFSPSYLSKQIRTANADITVTPDALLIIRKQFMRIYFMITAASGTVSPNISQRTDFPNTAFFLSQKFFIIGKTDIIPVIVNIPVFLKRIISPG